jgi:tetratricopeptide (TPR) repeat protein/ferredoxin
VGKKRPNNPLGIPEASESLKCGSLRLSKRGVWRAAVLIAVYVAIFLHIVHWKLTGRTVTPVEPSEAMQTLELGYVNAGIILFVVLILSTLIFGRFFCGWGCHVVALQDLCGWVLKKLHMKPKAFRSRLLVFVPLFAAFYMFVYPSLLRMLEGRKMPALEYHLTTENFWATFPTPGIAILTFVVCGFLIVWLVGNKGFCTYGCPYGAFFFYADKVAPGKIRVTDDCEQCGHCTATCTSNVRVHEEVARFGTVVDAGCMKCMDCVSVCPKNALYYGFGRTSLRVKPSKPAKAAKKFDFTWPEEIAMAIVFFASLYALRGLYDAVPLLLAVGLASVSAFLSVAAARALYAQHARWQRMQLRKDGGVTATGFGALAACFVWFVFLGHSAVWSYNFHEGNRLYDQALAAADTDPDVASADASVALNHFKWCADNGFFQVSTVEAALGTSYAFTGRLADGEKHLLKAVQLGPELTNAWVQLGRTQAAQGKEDAALKTFRQALKQDQKNAEAAHQAAVALVGMGKPKEALPLFEQAESAGRADPAVLTDHGLALAQAGRTSEAIEKLQAALDSGAPPVARFNLGLVYAEMSRFEDARRAFDQAIVAEPDFLAAKIALARLDLQLGDVTNARTHAESALEQSPLEPEAMAIWAEAVDRSGGLEAEIAKLIRSGPDDEAAWYRAAMLYRQKGDLVTAKSLFARLLRRNPNLPPPR